MVSVRLLVGMTFGALVAVAGGLFLGEYEFDEWLPILAGALLGLIVAEVVVSIGRHRSLPLAVMVALWSAAAVLLAGMLDANDTEPIKAGAYLSAGLSAVAAIARANRWGGGDAALAPDDAVDQRADAPAGDDLDGASLDAVGGAFDDAADQIDDWDVEGDRDDGDDDAGWSEQPGDTWADDGDQIGGLDDEEARGWDELLGAVPDRRSRRRFRSDRSAAPRRRGRSGRRQATDVTDTPVPAAVDESVPVARGPADEAVDRSTPPRASRPPVRPTAWAEDDEVRWQPSETPASPRDAQDRPRSAPAAEAGTPDVDPPRRRPRPAPVDPPQNQRQSPPVASPRGPERPRRAVSRPRPGPTEDAAPARTPSPRPAPRPAAAEGGLSRPPAGRDERDARGTDRQASGPQRREPARDAIVESDRGDERSPARDETRRPPARRAVVKVTARRRPRND